MNLYVFTTVDIKGKTKHYFKLCTYPKKTKIYRDCMERLDENEIETFWYSKRS